MAHRSPRRFRPTLDGYRLEDRVVPSAPVASAVSAQATVDPLNVPPSGTIINGGTITKDLNKVHAVFQAFIRKIETACTKASANLSNGGNPNSLLAGLQVYTSIQAGTLQVQLQRIAQSIPGGGQYLFSPPQGSLPAGTTYPDPASKDCGPDIRYYVPPDLRLQTQVAALVSTLNSATTLQAACSPNTVPTILTSYHNCRAATVRYVHCAVMQSVFIVPGWS